MNKRNRGFVPLPAIFLLGFIAIATGAITVIVARHNRESKETSGIEASTTPTIASTAAYSGPVSAQVESSTPSETNTKKTNQKAPVEQIKQPTTKEKATATSPDVPPVTSEETSVSPYKDSLKAIDTFLTNPTLQSLHEFCTSAKQLAGRGSTTSLNPDRTNLVQYQNTLYSDFFWCKYVTDEEPYDPKFGHYTFMVYDPGFLLPLTDSNDSDRVRKLQINYNHAVETAGQYGIIGYESDFSQGPNAGSDQRPDVVMTTVLDTYRSQIDGKFSNTTMPSGFIRTIMSPVELLTKAKQNYVSN